MSTIGVNASALIDPNTGNLMGVSSYGVKVDNSISPPFPIPASANNYPATATAATCNLAAATGKKNYCTGIFASISAGSTAQAAALQLVLRDGATGVGTIIWTMSLSCAADGTASVAVTNLNLPGTAGNAMTLEFTGAGVTASQQAVSLLGYTQ